MRCKTEWCDAEAAAGKLHCTSKCSKQWNMRAAGLVAAANKRAATEVRILENQKPCAFCGKLTVNARFCSKSCSAKTTNVEAPRRAPSTRQWVRKDKAQWAGTVKKRQYLEDWVAGKNDGLNPSGKARSGIRDYVVEMAGFACSQCGWNEINKFSGRCPLEVDHIDGNRGNNRFDNLRVLCPNCHSLTPTYMHFNRKDRQHN